MHNPVGDVKFPNPQNNHLRFYSREEVDQLLTSLKEYPQLHDISLLSLRTGLRFKKITGIKGQDLDLKNGIINVLDPKLKGGEIDHAYMTKREALK